MLLDPAKRANYFHLEVLDNPEMHLPLSQLAKHLQLLVLLNRAKNLGSFTMQRQFARTRK